MAVWNGRGLTYNWPSNASIPIVDCAHQRLPLHQAQRGLRNVRSPPLFRTLRNPGRDGAIGRVGEDSGVHALTILSVPETSMSESSYTSASYVHQ